MVGRLRLLVHVLAGTAGLTSGVAAAPVLMSPLPTELVALAQGDTAVLGSVSLGRPEAGAQLNSVLMPADSRWYVRNPADSHGTRETIDSLVAAITEVNRWYPGSPPLCIGDISSAKGGPLDRHISHQSGRDADLGWYFTDGPRQALVSGGGSTLDLARSWALVKALITSGDVELIMIDRAIQRRLSQHALASGEDQSWLDTLFQYPSGSRHALIRHVPGHRNHLHIRFHSRQAQERAQLLQPLLRRAGMLPINGYATHRVRPGESLWLLARRYGTTVAAIQAANGLSSSLLRAGRTYRIPVAIGRQQTGG